MAPPSDKFSSGDIGKPMDEVESSGKEINRDSDLTTETTMKSTEVTVEPSPAIDIQEEIENQNGSGSGSSVLGSTSEETTDGDDDLEEFDKERVKGKTPLKGHRFADMFDISFYNRYVAQSSNENQW